MQAVGNFKVCACCQEVKRLDAFAGDKRRLDNLCVYCRSCMKLYRNASRQKKLGHYRAVNRAWNEHNRERRREYEGAWRDRNRERLREYHRNYYHNQRKHQRAQEEAA